MSSTREHDLATQVVVAELRIAEVEAEVERLRLGDWSGKRNDYVGLSAHWAKRARDAEAEVERLSRRPDLTPEESVHLFKWLTNVTGGEVDEWEDPRDRRVFAALRAAAEQEGR